MFGEVWENVFGIQTLSNKNTKARFEINIGICWVFWSLCKGLIWMQHFEKRRVHSWLFFIVKYNQSQEKRSFRFSTWSFLIYQNHFFPKLLSQQVPTCPFFCWHPEDMGYFDWVDQFLAENPGYVELSDRMILVPLISQTLSQWSFLVPSIGGRYQIIPQLAGTIPLIYHL